jgi:RNA polymerase primary sigma factor
MSLVESAARAQRMPETDFSYPPSPTYVPELEPQASKATLSNPQHQIIQYLKEISQFPVLSQQEIGELCSKVQNDGDIAARDKVVNHNLRFVVYIANRFRGRGVDFADLIQEGTFGLMRAIEKYDFQKHQTQFITYAFYWVRKAILKAIEDHASTIRKAASTQVMQKRILNIRDQLQKETGGLPSPEDIAKRGNLDPSRVKITLSQMFAKTLSLDDQVYQNSGKKFTVRSKIADLNTLSPEQYFSATDELKQSLTKINLILASISSFTKRNQDIFTMRFGLEGSFEGKILDVVGHRFGLCKQSIKVITDEICRTLVLKGVISEPSEVTTEVEKIRSLIDIIGENYYLESGTTSAQNSNS